jgi:hypothetical protein
MTRSVPFLRDKRVIKLIGGYWHASSLSEAQGID